MGVVWGMWGFRTLLGLRVQECKVGYSDFHNFMRFTSKKMLNNILKNDC